MSRVPTVKQYRKLATIGATGIALAPTRSEFGPLLRHGWVETLHEDDKNKRFLPPVRITPAGLHAIAAGMERYRPAAGGYPQLDVHPEVTRLKGELAEARKRADDHAREAQRLRSLLARVAATLGGWNQ